MRRHSLLLLLERLRVASAVGMRPLVRNNEKLCQRPRVPWADFNCLKLPPDAEEKQNDYVMVADIFPTGWHATELAGMWPGDAVVIYGSGPVGLMAAHAAMIKGACNVMVVDRHPDRLQLAESIGAVAIDDSKCNPVDRVMELTHGLGADVGCECVGYQNIRSACHRSRPGSNERIAALLKCLQYACLLILSVPSIHIVNPLAL